MFSKGEVCPLDATQLHIVNLYHQNGKIQRVLFQNDRSGHLVFGHLRFHECIQLSRFPLHSHTFDRGGNFEFVRASRAQGRKIFARLEHTAAMPNPNGVGRCGLLVDKGRWRIESRQYERAKLLLRNAIHDGLVVQQDRFAFRDLLHDRIRVVHLQQTVVYHTPDDDNQRDCKR